MSSVYQWFVMYYRRFEDVFDTVLLATGRYALTKALNLEAAGVTVSFSIKVLNVK